MVRLTRFLYTFFGHGTCVTRETSNKIAYFAFRSRKPVSIESMSIWFFILTSSTLPCALSLDFLQDAHITRFQLVFNFGRKCWCIRFRWSVFHVRRFCACIWKDYSFTVDFSIKVGWYIYWSSTEFGIELFDYSSSIINTCIKDKFHSIIYCRPWKISLKMWFLNKIILLEFETGRTSSFISSIFVFINWDKTFVFH